MALYQLKLFNSGNTLQEYRDGIYPYFVKQEKNRIVKKVQDELNALVEQFCPDYVKQNIQAIINRITINDVNNFNHYFSHSKIALALNSIRNSIVNDADKKIFHKVISYFLIKLSLLDLDNPKNTVSQYLFEPQIFVKLTYNREKDVFTWQKIWQDPYGLYNIDGHQKKLQSSELSRDFARYISQDHNLEEVLEYMDSLITHINSNYIAIDNRYDRLVMELENLFYLMDQAIRSEDCAVDLGKVETIFTEAGQSPNPSITFRHAEYIIGKLKSLVLNNADKFMIAHIRDFIGGETDN